MKSTTRIPATGLLRDRLAQLIALWFLLSGSVTTIAATGKPPTQPHLSPSGLRLTDCSVQVPTRFKAEWKWTDGAGRGMVELWETSGKGGRQTHLVKQLESAKTPEISASLDKDSWYRLKVRNITENADVWLDVDFTTGNGLLPKVSLNSTAIRICHGSPFELIADVEGCNTSIQWYLNDNPISGATKSSLRRSASVDESGVFQVVVSTPAGKRKATCDVEVVPSTEIISQPESAEVVVGESLDLSVEAEGESLRYQWFKDGAPIPGADHAEISLPVTGPATAGTYLVVIGGTCGHVSSQPAIVTVSYAQPEVSIRPVAENHCPGDSIQLTADISGLQWHCQWFLNEDPIPGATSPTLQIRASEERSGTYSIHVYNPGGASEDSLEINVLPAVAISEQPESIRLEVGEPLELSVTAEGDTESRPLSYQWFKNQAAIPGATKDTLNIPTAQPSDAGSYSVVVTGQCGSARSAEALVEVVSPIAFLEEPPAMTHLHVGRPLRLTTRAVNATAFQWYFSRGDLPSIPVAGANQPTLSKEQATSAESGVYWVVASNAQDEEVQSSEATVEVLDPLSATISAKADTNSTLLVQFSISGLPQDPKDLKPLSLILLVDERQILTTNQPANQSRGLLKAKVKLTPGTHHATLLIEDFLGEKLRVTTSIQTAPAPAVEEPLVRFQRTESGLLVSWPKEFVLGEEPGQWQLLASFDLEEWYSAYYEEEEPLDLGKFWGVTIPWIDAGGNSDEAGFELETQEPVSEFFRLTPWKPETEVQE